MTPLSRIPVALAALAAGVATVCAPALSHATPSAPAAPVAWPVVKQATGNPGTLESTIKLGNCSAAWVRLPSSQLTDKSLLLTNGHCTPSGFIPNGKVLVNQAMNLSGSILDVNGKAVAKVKASKLMYATMFGTDAGLWELDETFDQLRQKTKQEPLLLRGSGPTVGEAITIPSGYWTTVYTCTVDKIVHQLVEDQWTTRQSIRYADDPTNCKTKGGTSGSPIVSKVTGEVVGVNNTGNDNGGKCTENNPCEKDENGKIEVFKGRGYGQQTWWFMTCLTPANQIDLAIPGCLLPKNGES